MKVQFLKNTMKIISAFLGLNEIPINAEENRSDFTDEQKEKLVEKLGAEKTQEIIEAIDKEIEMMSAGTLDLETINAELTSMIKESKQEQVSETEEEEEVEEEQDKEDGVKANIQKLKTVLKKQQEAIQMLVETPEEDVQPKHNFMNNNQIKHSATHLFGSGKSYDAFENRPWNERLRDMSAKATNFKDNAYIPTLIQDLEHFVLEYPEALTSLVGELRGLPAEWSRKFGVLDMVSDAGIIAGEIVQGRSKGWNAKNKFKIAGEIGKVFRKKIDIELSGYELQEIENTWIRSYNDVGSHPYKMKFVYRLLEELVKQQFIDDRKAQINGIFVETPAGDDYTGMSVNSQNGLLYLFHHYRDVEKKYRPFYLGKPTKENIVDYVKAMIELMPETDRHEEGLEIGLSYEKLQWYRERAGLLYQHQASIDEGKLMYKKNHPIDYPNIVFQPILDMTKTDFIYITKSKNIEIMEYKPEEKHFFTFEFLKRNLYIFADYRLGIRLKQVGLKLADGEVDFEKQMVWSNEVPVFNESITVPTFDDETGILKLTYPSVKIDENFKTDINAIEGVIPGQVVKIFGTSKLSAARKLKKTTSIAIEKDYELNTDGYILLYVQPDGTLKELARTTEVPVVAPKEVLIESGEINASEGVLFRTSLDQSLEVDKIVNGVSGQTIKIYGNGSENILTLTSSEVLKVKSNMVLDSEDKFIELLNVGDVWYEINRN